MFGRGLFIPVHFGALTNFFFFLNFCGMDNIGDAFWWRALFVWFIFCGLSAFLDFLRF
jgi:hypothetical protein